MTREQEQEAWVYLIVDFGAACMFGAWQQSLGAGGWFFLTMLMLATIFPQKEGK